MLLMDDFLIQKQTSHILLIPLLYEMLLVHPVFEEVDMVAMETEEAIPESFTQVIL